MNKLLVLVSFWGFMKTSYLCNSKFIFFFEIQKIIKNLKWNIVKHVYPTFITFIKKLHIVRINLIEFHVKLFIIFLCFDKIFEKKIHLTYIQKFFYWIFKNLIHNIVKRSGRNMNLIYISIISFFEINSPIMYLKSFFKSKLYVFFQIIG